VYRVCALLCLAETLTSERQVLALALPSHSVVPVFNAPCTAQALKATPVITQLKASHDCVDASGLQGVLALIQACPHLLVRDACCAGAVRFAPARGCIPTGSCIGNIALQSLDLSHTKACGPGAAEALGELLHPRNDVLLQTLKLAGCPIQDDGFHSLALGLSFNQQLTGIDLSDTGITDAGLMALDQVLSQV
jgi:hypothetical protein